MYVVERPSWSSPEEIEDHAMSRSPRWRSQQRTPGDSYQGRPTVRYESQPDQYRRFASAAHGAGRTVLLTAARMIEEGHIVKGSCYDYIDAVFKEAGHEDWRKREKVYRKAKKGPYVDLDLVEPGDWLWVVSYREGSNIRTHSVLFVAWENRERGIAHVVSHPGQGRAVSGRYQTYDVSETYNITRPSVEDARVASRQSRRRP